MLDRKNIILLQSPHFRKSRHFLFFKENLATWCNFRVLQSINIISFLDGEST